MARYVIKVNRKYSGIRFVGQPALESVATRTYSSSSSGTYELVANEAEHTWMDELCGLIQAAAPSPRVRDSVDQQHGSSLSSSNVIPTSHASDCLLCRRLGEVSQGQGCYSLDEFFISDKQGFSLSLPSRGLGLGLLHSVRFTQRDPSARLHYESFRNLQRAESHKSVDEVGINLLSPVKVGHFNFAHLGWPVKWMVPGVEMTTSNVDNGINWRSFSSSPPKCFNLNEL